MALSDCSVSFAKHSSHRAAHNVAASQHNGMAACDGHTRRLEQSDDTSWRAWVEQRVGRPGRKVADVVGVESAFMRREIR